jgi:hypothetical protein
MCYNIFNVLKMSNFTETDTKVKEDFSIIGNKGSGWCFWYSVIDGLRMLDIHIPDVETLMSLFGVNPRTFNWTTHEAFEPMYKQVVQFFGVSLAVYFKPRESNKYCVFVYTPSEPAVGIVFLHLKNSHYEAMEFKALKL